MLDLMDRLASSRRGSLWFAAVLLAIAPISVALLLSMWRSAYPITEMISLLEDADGSTVARFFDPSIRSWYRPLFHLTLWGFWNASGSLLTGLHWFRYPRGWLRSGASLAVRQLPAPADQPAGGGRPPGGGRDDGHARGSGTTWKYRC